MIVDLLDLGIEPFSQCIRATIPQVSENPFEMPFHHLGNLDDRFQSGMGRPFFPGSSPKTPLASVLSAISLCISTPFVGYPRPWLSRRVVGVFVVGIKVLVDDID